MRYLHFLSIENAVGLFLFTLDDQRRILSCLSSFPYDLPPVLVELQALLVRSLSDEGDFHD